MLAVAMGCDGALNAQIEDYYNFIDSRALYDWGFENFSYRTLLSANEVVERLDVELADGESVAMLRPAEDVRALYSVDRPLTAAPRIPEPYDTFANTFSYGKEAR